MNIFFKIFAPLFLCLVLASPVSAHTSLLESNPQRDSTIEKMPKEIVLVFGEDLLTINDSMNNYFVVFDSTNAKMSLSEITLDGAKLSARVLNDQIKSGKYSMIYNLGLMLSNYMPMFSYIRLTNLFHSLYTIGICPIGRANCDKA